MSDKKFVYASIFLFAGIFLIFLSLNHDVDSHGTKETFLVRTNGSVVCQSCIGLSDANFFYNFKKLFSGEKEDKN